VDVADPASVAAMMAAVATRWGTVDILVNNAGITRGKGLSNCSPEDFNAVMETNLSGSFHCSREAYPMMRANGGGHIVMIASQAAGWPGADELAYGTAKTAQVKLMLHLLDEFSRANRAAANDTFFAHAICPGAVDTPWYDGRPVDRSGMLKSEEVADLVLAVAHQPGQPRDFFEKMASGKTYRVGPVGIFAPHPNIIRIWRDETAPSGKERQSHE
jgi:NAD(P)-dependent dehydrogenase (short-subunit alcohol dehydrogenase family)